MNLLDGDCLGAFEVQGPHLFRPRLVQVEGLLVEVPDLA